MNILPYLHIIVFIPVAVLSIVATAAAAAWSFAEWREAAKKPAQPAPFRPVLVHDTVRNVPRRIKAYGRRPAVRVIYNGG